MSIKQLEPKALWGHFADLNAVPRPSKKEERVIQFMVDFGKSLNLSTQVDKTGNVIIKKPGTPGMEGAGAVILQSHLDMVQQKNNDTDFDFLTQGIEMFVDGDWVKAKGTTLGADNGIGVSAIMALLSSTDIPHPPLEAMFTIDEETGMTGAKELEGQYYDGKTLLNLDTEDDDELSIGCAGGIDTNTSYKYSKVAIKTDHVGLCITMKGLLGGHSGMDIIKGRGNANKLLNRILYNLDTQHQFQLLSFDGGSLRNAIPREAVAHIAVAGVKIEAVKASIAKIAQEIITEFKTVEPKLVVPVAECSTSGMYAVDPSDFEKINKTLYALHNGVLECLLILMDWLRHLQAWQRVIIKDGQFTTQSLQRSSVESTKDDIANTIKCTFESMDCEVQQGGDYPGWQPNRDSEILRTMEKLYVELFNEKPQIKACHAGLECGILGQHLPGVDMISFEYKH